MNLDYLQAFVATADKGSISAAARQLGKSQATVSVALSTLEDDLGITLFDRSGHKPALTQQGAQLLSHARAALTLADTFYSKALGMSGGTEDRVRLAVDDSLSPGRLSALLNAFRAAFPLVDVTLLEPAIPDVPILVRDGQADLAITISQEIIPTEYSTTTLGHLQTVAVVAANHPLARLTSVSTDDLAQYIQLFPQGHKKDSDFFYPPASERLWTVERFSTAVTLAEAGIGFAGVPEYLAAPGLRNGSLCAREGVVSAR